MKLEKAIEKVLKERSKIDIFECIDAIKEHSKSRQNDDLIADAIDEYLLSTGTTDITINYDKEEIVYREKLFADVSFRILLTSEEFSTKQLVIGHRFLPFIHPSTHPKKVMLIDEADNEIEIIEDFRSFLDTQTYYSLLPPYGLQHYDLDDNSNIQVYSYDLAAWMKRNQFKSKDNLLISVIDYDKNVFRLEKMSSRDVNAQKLVTQNMQQKLYAAFCDHMVYSDAMLPIDVQLFQAFAIADASIFQQAIFPLGPFISDHEELEIFNNGSYAFLNTQSGMEETFSNAYDDALYPDISNMGKATEMEGIFAEMGISYTVEFVEAKMIEQIHIQNQIDKDEIYRLLFKRGDEAFYNAAQRENFDKAFQKMSEKVNNNFSEKRLSPSEQRLLSQTLRLKMDVIGLLRDIDAKLTNPENFDFSMLMQLQPFENLTDGLLHVLTAQNDQKSQNLLGDISNQVKMMHEEFGRVRDFILDQVD